MAKQTNSTKLKGELTFDLDTHEITITEIVKEAEYTYDLIDILEQYNGKSIAFSITEDKDLEPIEE